MALIALLVVMAFVIAVGILVTWLFMRGKDMENPPPLPEE
jgi:hypothetical protein